MIFWKKIKRKICRENRHFQINYIVIWVAWKFPSDGPDFKGKLSERMEKTHGLSLPRIALPRHRVLAQVSEDKQKHLQKALTTFQKLGAEEDTKSVKEMMHIRE